MNKHFLKIGETIDNFTKVLCEQGFSYEESRDYMRLIYDAATKKYGAMNFYGIDKDGADAVIESITNEFNK